MLQEDLIMEVLRGAGCKSLVLTNKDGIILRLDEEFFIDLLGEEEAKLQGQSVFDLEKRKIFTPSLTATILNEKRPFTAVQNVKQMYSVDGEGFPIYDDQGEIKWVVTFFRDNITSKKVLQLYGDMLSQTHEENAGIHDYLDREPGIEDYFIFNEDAIEDYFTFNEEFKKMLKGIHRIAHYDVTILLTGKTGTGKSMLAKKIHKISGRPGKFIEVNCGAFAENLIESELYGYEGGAFTGAERGGKEGLIEAARHGTLFLDEISDLPFGSQVKLLNVLQEKKVRRVGSVKDIDVDCRFIAATNKDLEEEVRKGQFREDLFYRLNMASFYLPGLGERKEDIIPIAQSILNGFSKRYKQEFFFDHEVLTLFLAHSWAGNVRELENTIHRMVLMTNNRALRKELLPNSFFQPQREVEPDLLADCITWEEGKQSDLKTLMDDFEGAIIRNAVKQYGTSVRVAEALNISQTSASRKIRKYEVEKTEKEI